MAFRRISLNVFIDDSNPDNIRTVRLSRLIRKRNILRDMINVDRPTNVELLQWAKENHPHFIENTSLQSRVDELNELISTLRSLTIEDVE